MIEALLSASRMVIPAAASRGRRATPWVLLHQGTNPTPEVCLCDLITPKALRPDLVTLGSSTWIVGNANVQTLAWHLWRIFSGGGFLLSKSLQNEFWWSAAARWFLGLQAPRAPHFHLFLNSEAMRTTVRCLPSALYAHALHVVQWLRWDKELVLISEQLQRKASCP